MGKYDNLKTNDIINNWTIISYEGKNKHGHDSYICKCVCGNIRKVSGKNLLNNCSKSCGCMKIISVEVKKQKRKMYKQKYFQDNKERIREKRLAKQREARANFQNQYGVDVYHLKNKYKLNVEEYQEMVRSQNNKCFICGNEFNNDVKNNKPYVDHNHKTREIRKLICMNCNSALGHFKENVQSLKNAINYLEGNYEKINFGLKDL